ncbi:HAMP domain-containing sensor histidine kinase [Aliiglaciecola sp. 3_MG-2023]|uniref:histidine kinase dimerization/phospho-acceptor domain-containing protein n=1 Tax=Aliiglaciecola sp. 3_MG-2023 TaxID=3062644 RepID=UPI0026E2974E|nr:HAMP domain-containing sensor histidine kinase [Aliiglaciecola sp. 3_MG-2023]MDO6695423.1 HAMP domain-containing sensor histidine kinase [Aliiglaciecola sp. 3_MG-2023]
MIKFKSLKLQLFCAFGGLSLIICLFFIRLSFLFADIIQQNSAETILRNEGLHIASIYQQYKTIPDTSVNYISIYSDLSQLPPEIQQQFDQNQGVNKIHYQSNYSFLLSQPLANNAQVFLLLNRTQLESASHMSSVMPLFLFSISIGVSVLTLLSSWYLATLISRPVQSLTNSVIAHRSSQDCEIQGKEREDEIGHLAVAFSETFEQLQRALKREQDFTRDVSHELRTPITLIKNTLELSKTSPLDKEGFLILEQASNELKQTVEVLLALAREKNLEFNSLAILPIVEKTVLAIYRIYPHIGFQVNIAIPPSMKVTGNHYLISLLCQNLVNNGFYHGYKGGMKISAEGNKLIFENELSEIDERPYYQGLGHGQYLVNRIANVMGWDLSIEQFDDSYRVTVIPY